MKIVVYEENGDYAVQTVTTLIDLDDPFTATITGDFETIECTAGVIANSQKPRHRDFY
jgi:hypothetical protein